VRIPLDPLENIKRYAAQNNTTLINLLKAYLCAIPAQEPLDNVPIVRRLSSTLSQAVSIQGYDEHPDDKNGQ
jgi:hypothetical protein